MKTAGITGDELKVLIVVLCIFVAGFIILFHGRAGEEHVPAVVTAEKEQTRRLGDKARIVVDVAGAVWRPGVYSLPEGARVDDLLEKAGPRPDADVESLNRARVLYDGQKIFVASQAEGSGGEDGREEREKYVNINTATAEQLQTLPSIGPSRAADIVEYRRKNGPFASVDELRNISGIGDATVKRLRERVAVR